MIRGAKKTERWRRKWYAIENITRIPHKNILKRRNFWFDVELGKQYLLSAYIIRHFDVRVSELKTKLRQVGISA